MCVKGTSTHDILPIPFSQVLGINAASAALCVSDIPFDGPVAATRAVDTTGAVDILFAGTLDSVHVVRGSLAEVPALEVCTALERAHAQAVPVVYAQMDLGLAGGKEPRHCIILAPNKDCAMMTRAVTEKGFDKAYSDHSLSAEQRTAKLAEAESIARTGMISHFSGNLTPYDIEESMLLSRYDSFRNMILTSGIR